MASNNNDGNEAMEEGPDRYNVPALERGLRVLCEFSRESRTLSAPELARRFDLPRSTVFRFASAGQAASPASTRAPAISSGRSISSPGL